MPTTSTFNTYSDKLYCSETLNIYLDMNDANLSESAMKSLEPALNLAINEMQNLENGSISNPDENRQVGHYWLRNHSLAPSAKMSQQIEDTLNRIKLFAANVIEGRILNPENKVFSNILLIGIGGSALGPQFISDALDPMTGLKIHFLDNTDPDGIDRVLSGLSAVLSE
ncbi:MAG: glucose-6-phosphate isomerase, partial [Candidatus Marinimicrobia bacterium]|nr:glucose-6-phosphate isomerase [Candidatus Neomarinimicrobiota bacterium]MBT6712655.1 glucose-6-phosphate isomerase [Candidatus Neomarinimicrobiota bacterium]MBT7199703.1 glucose-6-phosphate isomerase [Candidatus Neomarinimicrobiota bacterium]MBT7831038.1 glucose-6-phosphate isomerase [Candidatus Neomarinimicrobiota bacterium]